MEEQKIEEQQTEKKEEKKSKIKFGEFHDKYYKLLLLIPTLLLLFSFVYMGIFYSKNHDFMYKDVSLTGGTSATINGKIDAKELKQALSDKLENINTREIYDLITREQIAITLETKTDGEKTKQVLEDYLGYELNGENSSFEFTSSTLSKTFYKQLLIALLFSFAFMLIVVFIIFRTFVPSFVVILSAFADIFMTLTLVNILGLQISSAGIVAFLMLIGYSVDTDILLTNKVLKSSDNESLNQRIFRAFRTGIMMTLTSIVAIAFALIIIRPFSSVLNQIFTILVIGLGFDLINTWITNVSILKWYKEKKK